MGKRKTIRMSMQDVYEQTGFCKSLTEETVLHDEIEDVDGSDIDRLLNELKARGGADAILGRFLRDKVVEYWATIDPESCVNR